MTMTSTAYDALIADILGGLDADKAVEKPPQGLGAMTGRAGTSAPAEASTETEAPSSQAAVNKFMKAIAAQRGSRAPAFVEKSYDPLTFTSEHIQRAGLSVMDALAMAIESPEPDKIKIPVGEDLKGNYFKDAEAALSKMKSSAKDSSLDMRAASLTRGMTSKQTDTQPTVSTDTRLDRFDSQGEVRDLPALDDEDAPELDTRSNELLDKELPSAGLGSRPVEEEQPDAFFDRATEFLTLNEGFRNKPYKDSRGFWTVGIGHLITTEKDLPEEWKNANLTDDEVKALFKEDYNKHLNEAKKLPMYEKLNEEGKLALLDLTFNMGTTRFNEDKWPKFFSALENKDLETAAQELENSKWFNQVGNRAPRVIDLIQKASYN